MTSKGDAKQLLNCEIAHISRKSTFTDEEACAGPKSSLAQTLQEDPSLCQTLSSVLNVGLTLLRRVSSLILALTAIITSVLSSLVLTFNLGSILSLIVVSLDSTLS